jgi:hypothetical protein
MKIPGNSARSLIEEKHGKFFASYGPATITFESNGGRTRSMNQLTQLKRVAQLFLIPCLTVAMLIRRDWIEVTLGWIPDGDSGLAELLLASALVFGFLGRRRNHSVRAERIATE